MKLKHYLKSFIFTAITVVIVVSLFARVVPQIFREYFLGQICHVDTFRAYEDPKRTTLGIYDFKPDVESVWSEKGDHPCYPSRVLGYPTYTDGIYEESDEFKDLYSQTETLRNLGKIGRAIRRYTEYHEGRLPPPYTKDAQGNILHSWRVLILPYFDGGESSLRYLYEQIRLDEPWDSEWNRQFFSQKPAVYDSAFRGDNSPARGYIMGRKEKLDEKTKEEYTGFSETEIEIRKEMTFFTIVMGENTAFPNSGTDFEEGRGIYLCRPVKEISLILNLYDQMNKVLAERGYGKNSSDKNISVATFKEYERILDKLKELHPSLFPQWPPSFLQATELCNQITLSEDEVFYGNVKILPLGVVERAQPVCWMDPTQELTLDDITNGSFLNSIRKNGRRRDKTGRFYIPCVRIVPRAYFGESHILYSECLLLNDTVTVEDLTNLATFNRETPPYEPSRRRIVKFQ